MEGSALAASARIEDALEQHRRELTGYCYWMLGSPFEAEDAVQETLLRAWRAHKGFEGRSALRSWLYRIATNVCLDSLRGRSRRALPMDLGPAGAPEPANLATLPPSSWIEPIPQTMLAAEVADPAQHALQQDALQSMPPHELWLQGREDILAWWMGPGIGCRGSRLLPAPSANGAAVFGQYRISETGSGHDPWALQVIELGEDGIARMTFFLTTERLFALFGLPPHLDS